MPYGRPYGAALTALLVTATWLLAPTLLAPTLLASTLVASTLVAQQPAGKPPQQPAGKVTQQPKGKVAQQPAGKPPQQPKGKVAQQPAGKPPTTKPPVAKPSATLPEAKKTAATKPTATKRDPAPATPPIPRRSVLQFTTPDQSRFVLIQAPDMPQVHWVIASWADGNDDPPGLSGLALVTAQTSLKGTWTTGSLDITAEQQAMAELDAAWQEKMASPGNAKFEVKVKRIDKVVRQLSDPRRYHRVLAAAPAFHPEVVDHGAIAITALTTIEPALGTIARLLLERREDQALRELFRTWQPHVSGRLKEHMQQPRRRMHAELLALIHPYSAGIQRLEAPLLSIPSRGQAMTTWQSSQHPTRTVNVLYGSLDLQKTKAMLEKVFATTNLPAIAPRRSNTVRPMTAQRRSVVPGIPSGGVALGWVLPANLNPWAVEIIRRWLTSKSGPLLRALLKSRPKLTMRCHAPWPRTSDSAGLLMLDVIDPSGQPDLDKAVLEACQEIASKDYSGNPYYKSYRALLHDWNRTADSSRTVAITLAERALMWPEVDLKRQPPAWVKPTAITATLKSIFASQPAIVEGQQ